MKDERRPSILGLLIVLIALVLVAVGIIGLISRNGRTVIAVPGIVRGTTSIGSAAKRDAPPEAEAVVEVVPTTQSAATEQSAVVRGGSRNKPTAPVAVVQPTQAEPTAVLSADPATREVMLPGKTAPMTNTAEAGSLVTVPATSALRIEVLSAIYDVSGTPSRGCAVFDNHMPARRFTFQLAVVNDSGVSYQPGEWGAAAYADAARATLCLSGTSGLPAFVNATRQPITFVAFTEPDQWITSVSINTLNGLSARVCFEEEHVVACPAS